MSTNTSISVKQKPFEFNGRDFLINGIKRCPVKRLHVLLISEERSLLGVVKSKSTKREQSTAFWSAQCIHYGLPPVRAKDAAKRMLLQALENKKSKLTVPTSIREIEKELKAQHQAATAGIQRQTNPVQEVFHENPDLESFKWEQTTIDLEAVRPFGASRRPRKYPLIDRELIYGCFTMDVPDLHQGLPEHPSKLWIIRESRPSNVYWGWFDIGNFTGYMKSIDIDRQTRTLTFSWRGRDHRTGESLISGDNVVQLGFEGGKHPNRFTGLAWSDRFETCDISGTRDPMFDSVAKDQDKARNW